MSRQKDLYGITDTETTNSYLDIYGKPCLQDSLVYDVAVAIIDNKGKVYDVKRFICEEIFHSQMMTSAYYANKIPQYLEAINNGDIEVLPIKEIRKRINAFLKSYNVKAIMAHNAKFDYRALNNTIRYLTGSKNRFFFPYGLPIWDTQSMAHDTICKQKKYIKFCQTNNYMTKHKTPRPRETAEILYRYISNNNEFIEAHTGYEDIMIEKEIFAYCVKQHKRMKRQMGNPITKKNLKNL